MQRERALRGAWGDAAGVCSAARHAKRLGWDTRAGVNAGGLVFLALLDRFRRSRREGRIKSA